MSDRISSAKTVDILGLIEKTTSLKKVSSREWAGPCPKCGGKDRFRIDPDKGWFCRQCSGEPGSGGHWQDQIDFVMWMKNCSFPQALTELTGDRGFTKQELDHYADLRKNGDMLRRDNDRQEAAAAQTKLNHSPDLQAYPSHPRAVEEWKKRGLQLDWIAYYGLGFAEQKEFWCGDEKFYSNSLTIPYFRYDDQKEEYKIINLKHRLLMEDPPGGKYRNHIRGCGAHLFKTDILQKKAIGNLLIVEGEIKSIITWQSFWLDDYCIEPNLTIWGLPSTSWTDEMIGEIKSSTSVENIFVCLDPDAQDKAKNLCGIIGAKNISLPGKIDDLLLAEIIGAYELLEMMRYG